jgi:hypothetical protein
MNQEEIEKVLGERVTQYTPELQKLKKVDLLVTELNDALTDLHEREITAISLYRTLNLIMQIPATSYFIEQLISLRRSRDRLGRQEFVEVLKRRPAYYTIPYEFEMEEEAMAEQRRGMLSRITGLFRRKR